MMFDINANKLYSGKKMNRYTMIVTKKTLL